MVMVERTVKLDMVNVLSIGYEIKAMSRIIVLAMVLQ